MIRDTLHDLHRPLGDTSLAVSPLGLGIVKFGRDQGVKYPSGFTISDDRGTTNLLALTHDLGINLIDTVPAYGRSEERLDSLLRGRREYWVVASKVGGEFADSQSVFDFSATHIRRSVERSLRRLETERTELALVHSDGNDPDILENNEAYPTLAALKCEGLIGTCGLSGKIVEGGLRALRESDCAMATYNLNEHAGRPVVEYTMVRAKGILVKKTLASGHAYPDAGQDLAHTSFELVFDQPGVAAAIVGTISPLYLVHNVTMAVQALKKARTIHRSQHLRIDTCGAFRCHVPPE